ncbi:MAG: hypothetical protein GXP50_03195 [Deltaproteobacteria bacterium]|nr:hypothetical protein [Deltaproteobacteria bacterium]
MNSPVYPELRLFLARLHTAMRKGQGRRLLPDLLDEIDRYARIRFAQDLAEKALRSPTDLAQALAVQREFLEELVGLRKRVGSGPPRSGHTMEALRLLRRWGWGAEALQEPLPPAA